MGEYLASGRPVVTTKVGDLTEFLTNDVNAYVGEPGTDRDFAEEMIAVLRDLDRAAQIGRAGQLACFMYLDYRAHASGLVDFFVRCIRHSKDIVPFRNDSNVPVSTTTR